MGQAPLSHPGLAKRIAELLRDKAEELGVQNQEIAARSGFSESTISRTFNLLRTITVTETEAIAHALGLVAWQVVYEAETGQPYRRRVTADDFTLAALSPGYNADLETDQ